MYSPVNVLTWLETPKTGFLSWLLNIDIILVDEDDEEDQQSDEEDGSEEDFGGGPLQMTRSAFDMAFRNRKVLSQTLFFGLLAHLRRGLAR